MHTYLCSTAIQLLQNYLDQPDENDRLDDFVQHSVSCQACSFDLSYLLEALRTGGADSITCQMCKDRLPEFVEAESEGIEKLHAWLAVTQHLNTCPHCRSEYMALKELITLSTPEIGSTPISYPFPDISFLRQEGPPTQRSERFWRPSELGNLVIHFSAELLASLAYKPVALQGLKSTSSGALYQISVDEAFSDFDVAIVVEENRRGTGLCTLVVKVTNSDLDWPQLAGSQVTLMQPGGESTTQETDPYGEAVFQRINRSALPNLTIEVRPFDRNQSEGRV